MKTFETNVIVYKETPNYLYLVPEATVRYSLKMPPHKGGGTLRMKETVKIAKKYVLEGSDDLGDPDYRDKEKKKEGKLVIPQWLATQNCMFTQPQDGEMTNVRTTETQERPERQEETTQTSPEEPEELLQGGSEEFKTTAQR